jgi:hypothetical protein
VSICDRAFSFCRETSYRWHCCIKYSPRYLTRTCYSRLCALWNLRFTWSHSLFSSLKLVLNRYAGNSPELAISLNALEEMRRLRVLSSIGSQLGSFRKRHPRWPSWNRTATQHTPRLWLIIRLRRFAKCNLQTAFQPNRILMSINERPAVRSCFNIGCTNWMMSVRSIRLILSYAQCVKSLKFDPSHPRGVNLNTTSPWSHGIATLRVSRVSCFESIPIGLPWTTRLSLS